MLDELVDRAAQRIGGIDAEHRLGSAIEQNDFPVFVDGDHPVGHRMDQALHSQLGCRLHANASAHKAEARDREQHRDEAVEAQQETLCRSGGLAELRRKRAGQTRQTLVEDRGLHAHRVYGG